MRKILILISISLLTSSCFKTAEQIRRDKLVDNMSVQLKQSSALVADLTMQVSDLQTRLASATGQLEEIDHKSTTRTKESAQTFTQTIAQLSEQVTILTKENNETKQKVANLSSELKSQKKFITKVTGTLTKMTGPTKSSSASKLAKAHKAFEKNHQKNAMKLYLEVLEDNKINARQKNHVSYNIGLLYTWKKKYDEALAYFGPIYTNWPKSSWAPRALLQIARTFKKQGKTQEANATYEEIISKYKNSSQAKSAKKELK
jgi:TolA-binding protein